MIDLESLSLSNTNFTPKYVTGVSVHAIANGRSFEALHDVTNQTSGRNVSQWAGDNAEAHTLAHAYAGGWHPTT